MPEVQIRVDNYDIKNNPQVKTLYPNLYKEVKAHDLDSFSSWYNLSDIAFAEFKRYIKNTTIGYMRAN